jgi:hypothetical protein
VKSSNHVVPMLVALTLAAMLSGCSKNTTPTGPSVPSGPAPLDQSRPATPSQIAADTDASNSSASLEWTASSSANAASYEVYQYLPCPQSESAYVLVGQTDATTTSYSLPWTPRPTTLYYRLRTVSATGVKSDWSTTVEATVGPALGGENDPEGIKER